VREAFRKRGHDAWSCDLLDCEDNSQWHLQCDVFEALDMYHGDGSSWPKWDLVIAHPPCTDLCNSGSRWWAKKCADGTQQKSVNFFLQLVSWLANGEPMSGLKPVKRWAIENPIGIMSTKYRKPDQIIQPWQFGHGETKATCLWLNGLPKLTPTNIVDGREPKCHFMPPSKDRWKERSRTYQGIADAMAEQWGNPVD
jgi:site-specific DNA-cytosine methylase